MNISWLGVFRLQTGVLHWCAAQVKHPNHMAHALLASEHMVGHLASEHMAL